MTMIWLIRHGESESNAGQATGPTAAIGLTPLGQAQAEALASAFDRAPDLIVSSGYQRAIDTAAPTRARFPQARYEQWPIHEVAVLSDASRNNTTPAQRQPLVQAYWQRADPQHVDGPGAESFAQLIERARGALDRLRQLESPFVAVFGHGLFTRALLWAHFVAPVALDAERMRAFRSFLSGFRIPNVSIIQVYRTSERQLLFGAPSVAHLPPAMRTAEPSGAAPRPQED